MKHLMKLCILSLSLLAFGLQVAEAKRFGGGKSFGYSKQIAPKQYKNTPPSAAKPAAGTAAQSGAKASGASRFLGPLAGLAAGGLLAAMLFGDGFEGLQIMDILIFVLIGSLIWMFLKRRRTPTTPGFMGTPSGSAPVQTRVATPPPTEPMASSAGSSSSEGSLIGSAVSDDAEPQLVAPAWFDEAVFIEGAKGHFVAVQKAWDALDATELASYCTPELYSALQHEMADLTPGSNHTEVDELYAETASMAMDGDYFVVSVRFSGFIKENAEADAHAFSEIWHIRRLAQGSGNWEISGIQQ